MAGGNLLQNKITILAELWMNYREDEELEDFIEYNDIGLPLAYLLMNEIVLPSDESAIYINETYDLFVSSLAIPDKEWESLDEMLGFQAQPCPSGKLYQTTQNGHTFYEKTLRTLSKKSQIVGDYEEQNIFQIHIKPSNLSI